MAAKTTMISRDGQSYTQCTKSITVGQSGGDADQHTANVYRRSRETSTLENKLLHKHKLFSHSLQLNPQLVALLLRTSGAYTLP